MRAGGDADTGPGHHRDAGNQRPGYPTRSEPMPFPAPGDLPDRDPDIHTGGITIVLIWVAHLPMALPDHNLLAAWGIDLGRSGYTQTQLMERLHVGYLCHSMGLFSCMVAVVAGILLVGVYRSAGETARVRPRRAPVCASSRGYPMDAQIRNCAGYRMPATPAPCQVGDEPLGPLPALARMSRAKATVR